MKILSKIKSCLFLNQNKELDPYWIQTMEVIRVADRMEIFESYCTAKKVLHIGCTDYPIFKPESNLHLKLGLLCEELHGLDVDAAGILELKKYFNSVYFTDFSQIEKVHYDVVLAPETIEHVDNVAMFLKNIENLSANAYIITAPNCFHSFFRNGFKSHSSNIWIEGIHPDHNCWYSPYTLKNTIEKYTKLKVADTYLSNSDLMTICVCK